MSFSFKSGENCNAIKCNSIHFLNDTKQKYKFVMGMKLNAMILSLLNIIKTLWGKCEP